VLANLRAAQGVVHMAKKFGAVRLEAACQRALSFESPRYRTVKQILEKGLDQSVQADLPALSPVYTGEARFLRDITKLLH
jgi:hypothetical protein